MQTTKTNPYHCAELRRSVPVFQRIEWVSGIGQDDSEPVVLAGVASENGKNRTLSVH